MSSARLISPRSSSGDPHQGDGLAPDRGPQMLDDLFPVELPVLGVDHDPIQPEATAISVTLGRFQRHPQPIDRLTGRELFSEFSDRERVHNLGGMSRGDGHSQSHNGRQSIRLFALIRVFSQKKLQETNRYWTGCGGSTMLSWRSPIHLGRRRRQCGW